MRTHCDGLGLGRVAVVSCVYVPVFEALLTLCLFGSSSLVKHVWSTCPIYGRPLLLQPEHSSSSFDFSHFAVTWSPRLPHFPHVMPSCLNLHTFAWYLRVFPIPRLFWLMANVSTCSFLMVRFPLELLILLCCSRQYRSSWSVASHMVLLHSCMSCSISSSDLPSKGVSEESGGTNSGMTLCFL